MGDDATSSIKEAKNFKSSVLWGEGGEVSIFLKRQELWNAADADAEQTPPGQVPAKHFGQDPIGQDPISGQGPPPTDQGLSDKEIQHKVQQRLSEAFATEIESNGLHKVPYKIFAMPHVESQDEMEHPLFAYKAKSDPDTMYLHEAMQQPD